MFSFGLKKTKQPNLDAIKSKLKNNQAVLVDIRENFEVAQGMIEGANWLPMSDLQQGGGRWKEFLDKWDPSKTLAIYCRTGSRASFLLDFFEQQGLDAVNLGGLASLQLHGMKVIYPTQQDLEHLNY